jgi:hypothetical protein
MSKKAKGRLPKTPNVLRKYRAVQDRYNELYSVQRKRIDDCVSILAKEYFHTEAYVWVMLRTQLPDESQIPVEPTPTNNNS